jgi:hypothetical protein
MLKAMTFIVKKIARPNRVKVHVASPASPRALVTSAAKRQPKQQYRGWSIASADSDEPNQHGCEIDSPQNSQIGCVAARFMAVTEARLSSSETNK